MLTEMTDMSGRGGGGGGSYQPPQSQRQGTASLASAAASSSSSQWSTGPPPSGVQYSPLVSSCRHLLRPNGSILGSDVARTILPLYPSVVSAIPAEMHRTSAGHHHALASIDGRRPIGHARIRSFVLSEFGPTLHSMGFGRGHRIAVVLPNGPELAMAILSISNWASCVPLNAAGSTSELDKDLRGADVDLVIGPYSGPPVPDGGDIFLEEGILQSKSADTCDLAAANPGALTSTPPRRGKSKATKEPHTPHSIKRYAVMPKKATDNAAAANSDFVAFDHVRETAVRLGIPFVGLQPSRTEAGIFSLVGTAQARPRNRTRGEQRRFRHQSSSSMSGRGGGAANPELGDAVALSPGGPPAPEPPLPVEDLLGLNTPKSASDEADKSGGTPHRRRGSSQGAGDRGGQYQDQSRRVPAQDDDVSLRMANTHEDEVLVLFTSGTTGTKKLVPHCLGEMLVATATIALSWNLTPADTNCNLMPLFHVGGIVRQVFSPVLSGGCVICCPNFDPSIFWALLNNRAFNWYYAAPTMHQIILQTGKEQISHKGRDSNLVESTRPKLRMIANAAGGLLPSLATELRKTFRANVLPSYGMTECMPISSPPSDYRLERPGTSGVAVGPEIGILDVFSNPPIPFPPMKEGPICVRGAPCFRGYGRNLSSSEGSSAVESKASFLPGGWFNTGDLGYLDEDGYLYITGRSKEVINRGGEIISPLEVEEAVLSHPDVRACAAFSTPHDILQEVVGIMVVPESGRPRTDLYSLHEFLGQERLAAPKWPQCLVFVDALPKSHTNKLLRVKLAQRLGLPEMNDRLYPVERTFAARCPPQGTDVKEPIRCEQVTVDPRAVRRVLVEALVDADGEGGDTFTICSGAASCAENMPCRKEVHVTHHPSRIGSVVCYVRNIDRLTAVMTAQEKLDRYAVPTHFMTLEADAPAVRSERDLPPPRPEDAVSAILQGILNGKMAGPVDPLVAELQTLWSELLDLDCAPHPSTNFFNLGGSSMLASQLAARLRKRHSVPLSGAEIFHHASCAALAKLIHERREEVFGGSPRNSSAVEGGANFDSRSTGSGNSGATSTGTSQKSTSSSAGGMGSLHSMRKDMDLQDARFSPVHLAPKTSIVGKLFQLVPLTLVFPVYEFTRFFCFFYTLLNVLNHVPGGRNMWKFVLTVVVFHCVWITVTPLVFVLIKWTVIGKFKEGRYPLWGQYYLRWWFVDVCAKLFGHGIFGRSDGWLAFYYRLLGAKIGAGARISLSTSVGEYDLVTVGANAAVDDATLRPFGVDNGAMILGPVRVGENSSVGNKSVVAPHTSVPDDAHLGPQSTSYDTGRALRKANARFNRKNFAEPHWLVQWLVGYPITLIDTLCSRIPPLFVLWLMIRQPWRDRGGDDAFNTMGDMLEWLCDPRRVPFYIAIRLSKNLLSPLFQMTAAILIKWIVIGKFKPGPKSNSQWQLLRHWLAAKLFTREKLQDVAQIIGRHYEGVSILYRLLGAKVGKRVFWPGSQIVTTGEFDLLEIGDDVVFGSRSVIFTSTADSLETVHLSAGSNVADNCVVLPGSTLGKNAVLGSNGLCPGGWYLPESSVWFGSRGCEPLLLEKGVDDGVAKGKTIAEMRKTGGSIDELCPLAGDDATLRPFGKAFYKRDATYFVWPLVLVNLMNNFVAAFIVVIHSTPLIGALHIGAATLYGAPFDEREYDNLQFRPGTVYGTVLAAYIVTHCLRSLMWVAVEVGSKWAIMGRRHEGRYNWDTSTYNQRWELHQTFQRMRDLGRISFLDLLRGSPYMAQFWRLNGAKIGRDVCLYPAGASPYMSEPCLITVGDRCAVDHSSLVCHLNTRGNFELVPSILGEHTTLRTKSRIQMGGRMERGSMLLEHSLAMTGEVIEADSVWYGSPAVPIMYLGIPNLGRTANTGAYIPNDYGSSIV